MKIGKRAIGTDQPPFVIAEMSGNHGGSLERALQLVDAAADAGADALKLQTYTPDTMTLDIDRGEFFIDDPRSLWKGQSLYSLFQKAQTPWEWHEPIFERARSRGLIAFSTPFDSRAVEFLEGLEVPCYKIASFENTDLPLIRTAAATGKPVLISTGLATVAELEDAVATARKHGSGDIMLLKCTSAYPASPDDSHLRTIPHLRALFGCEVGLSDHTRGIGAATAAVALGASVIEKHLTLNRDGGGVDAAFSLEPAELESLVKEARSAWQALGAIQYGPTEAESGAVRRRRSLYVTQDLKAGDVLSQACVRAIRPGLGLPPKYLDVVLGMRVRVDVKRGTPLRWELIRAPEFGDS